MVLQMWVDHSSHEPQSPCMANALGAVMLLNYQLLETTGESVFVLGGYL